MPTTIVAAVATAATSQGNWTLVGASSVLDAINTNDGDTKCLEMTAGPETPAVVTREVTIPAGALIIGGPVVYASRINAGESFGTEINLKLDGQAIGSFSGAHLTTYQTFSGNAVAGSAVYAGSSPQVLSAELQPGAPVGIYGARVTFLQFGVTYNQSPTAPSLTGPVGTVSTLTPQFTGNHNDPDGDGMSAVEIEVRRVSDNALMWSSSASASGSSFSRAYAGTTLVSGTQYKWRARTTDNSSAANNLGAWSEFTTFTPTINTAPVASIISPTGNPTVGTLTPTLQFSYSDADGDAQAGYQLQVRRFSDQVSFWDPGQQAGAVTSVVYAGTTLVGGTRYEWRVRVQDSKGAWSDYTGWASFTPAAVPNPPTSLTPTGLQNTLTPTVAGVYNQGTGAPEAAFQYEVRQGGITSYSSGDVATVIATGQAYGTNNPSDTPAAPPALSWGTSYQIRARSKDTGGQYSEWSSWQAFSTNAAPTTPTSLQPNGAITGNTTPTLSWTHNDPNGDAQTEAEIELEEIGVGFVSGYDPKTLAQSTTTHVVTETLTASPATEYRWRVRTKGTAGPGFGPWSSWVTFTVANAPSFAVDNPTPSMTVAAPALAVQWTMSGGSGTQQSYRVRIFAEDQVTVVHDSGVVGGTAEEHVLATGILQTGRTYYVRVSGEDTLSQGAQSGLVEFTTAWTPPATITGLQAQSIGSQE